MVAPKGDTVNVFTSPGEPGPPKGKVLNPASSSHPQVEVRPSSADNGLLPIGGMVNGAGCKDLREPMDGHNEKSEMAMVTAQRRVDPQHVQSLAPTVMAKSVHEADMTQRGCLTSASAGHPPCTQDPMLIGGVVPDVKGQATCVSHPMHTDTVEVQSSPGCSGQLPIGGSARASHNRGLNSTVAAGVPADVVDKVRYRSSDGRTWQLKQSNSNDTGGGSSDDPPSLTRQRQPLPGFGNAPAVTESGAMYTARSHPRSHNPTLGRGLGGNCSVVCPRVFPPVFSWISVTNEGRKAEVAHLQADARQGLVPLPNGRLVHPHPRHYMTDEELRSDYLPHRLAFQPLACPKFAGMWKKRTHGEFRYEQEESAPTVNRIVREEAQQAGRQGYRTNRCWVYLGPATSAATDDDEGWYDPQVDADTRLPVAQRPRHPKGLAYALHVLMCQGAQFEGVEKQNPGAHDSQKGPVKPKQPINHREEDLRPGEQQEAREGEASGPPPKKQRRPRPTRLQRTAAKRLFAMLLRWSNESRARHCFKSSHFSPRYARKAAIRGCRPRAEVIREGCHTYFTRLLSKICGGDETGVAAPREHFATETEVLHEAAGSRQRCPVPLEGHCALAPGPIGARRGTVQVSSDCAARRCELTLPSVGTWLVVRHAGEGTRPQDGSLSTGQLAWLKSVTCPPQTLTATYLTRLISRICAVAHATGDAARDRTVDQTVGPLETIASRQGDAAVAASDLVPTGAWVYNAQGSLDTVGRGGQAEESTHLDHPG